MVSTALMLAQFRDRIEKQDFREIIEGIVNKGYLYSLENARVIRNALKKPMKYTVRRGALRTDELVQKMQSQLGIPGSREQDKLLSQRYFQEYVLPGVFDNTKKFFNANKGRVKLSLSKFGIKSIVQIQSVMEDDFTSFEQIQGLISSGKFNCILFGVQDKERRIMTNQEEIKKWVQEVVEESKDTLRFDGAQRMIFEKVNGLKQRSLLKSLVVRAEEALKFKDLKYAKLISPSSKEEMQNFNQSMDEEQISQILQIAKFSKLIELMRYAHFVEKDGCPSCEVQLRSSNESYLSLLSDYEFDRQFRYALMAQSIIDSARQSQRLLVVVREKEYHQIVRKLAQLIAEIKQEGQIVKNERTEPKQAKLEALFEIETQATSVKKFRREVEEELKDYGKWQYGKFNRDTSKCYAYKHLTGLI